VAVRAALPFVMWSCCYVSHVGCRSCVGVSFWCVGIGGGGGGGGVIFGLWGYKKAIKNVFGGFFC
jgi:hypothetical protein